MPCPPAALSEDAVTCAESATFLPKSFNQKNSSRRTKDRNQGAFPLGPEMATALRLVLGSVVRSSGGWRRCRERFHSR